MILQQFFRKLHFVGKPIKKGWRSSNPYSSRKSGVNQIWFVILLSILLFFSLVCIHDLFMFGTSRGLFSASAVIKNVDSSLPNNKNTDQNEDSDACFGRRVYIHNLPSGFHEDLLRNCQMISRATDKINMCNYIVNLGLGPEIEDSDGVLSKKSWFSTNQFLLEVIFHNRMRKYECLTNDSSLASAIFVPFYAGLDLRRHLWGFSARVRDSSGLDLVKWLIEKPEWKKMLGRDHFFVSGRIARDFRRKSNRNSDWGSNFRFLPGSENMSMLTIESSSWDNDFGIPYPTYFHPSDDREVFEWQDLMRRQNRAFLFSFAGAKRSRQKGSIRGKIISQCLASRKKCKLLDCAQGNCDDPVNLMRLFQNSVFCLQPPGDSFTRRSTFDSILAGCIPVFFHPKSAYTQYLWHLPKNHSKYSVYISAKDLRLGKARINETLLGFSEDEVLAMREEVIKLIPRIIYADPSSRLKSIEDAFDLAVKGILDKIEREKKKKQLGGMTK